MAELVTEVLLLRELEARDIKLLWQQMSQDLNGIPAAWPKNKNNFDEWIVESILEEFPTKYVIEHNSGTTPKAITGIISIDIITNQNQINYQMADQGDANVSYMTFPQFAGLGIATFAVQEISKILLEHNLKPILRIETLNKASARVAIKCGFIKDDSAMLIQDFFDDEPTILDIYRKIII